jgi:hypothetical protein
MAKVYIPTSQFNLTPDLILKILADKFAAIGVPADVSTAKVQFLDRSDGEVANGLYDIDKDEVTVFLPQRPHAPVDTLWSLVHEVAHRIWYKYLDRVSKQAWLSFVQNVGSRFTPEAIKARIAAIKSGKHDALWFWFKANKANDYAKFADYLKSVRYANPGLPRDYSASDAKEAWADGLTDLVLGRSRNGSKMQRLSPDGKKLMLTLIRTSKVECVQGKVIPSRLLRGPLFGETPPRFVIFDAKLPKKDVYVTP